MLSSQPQPTAGMTLHRKIPAMFKKAKPTKQCFVCWYMMNNWKRTPICGEPIQNIYKK
jgi:hypothetical protein